MAPHSSSGVIQYLRSQKWFEKTFFYTVYEAENVTVASELKLILSEVGARSWPGRGCNFSLTKSRSKDSDLGRLLFWSCSGKCFTVVFRREAPEMLPDILSAHHSLMTSFSFLGELNWQWIKVPFFLFFFCRCCIWIFMEYFCTVTKCLYRISCQLLDLSAKEMLFFFPPQVFVKETSETLRQRPHQFIARFQKKKTLLYCFYYRSLCTL